MIRSLRRYAVALAAAVPVILGVALTPVTPASAAPQVLAYCGQTLANRVGTARADTFTAAPGDVFVTFGGADTIYTDNAATTLLACLDEGSDYFGPVDIATRPTGAFYVIAGLGSDVVYGGTGEDIFEGREGGDSMLGGPSRDVLYGQADNDHLLGEEGDDFLDGGFGNDVLFGGAGNDYLWGDSGADANYGGPGFDRCFKDDINDTFIDCEVIER